MSRGDFWSRRKAAVRAEAKAAHEAEQPAPVAVDADDIADVTEDLRSDDEILSEAGFAEPESCQSAAELREFLRSDLPQRFKTRALRHLWRLNPVLANLDGLVEYGEDYTDASRVVENLQTVYKAGRGMLDRIAELEKDREDKNREMACLNAVGDAGGEAITHLEPAVGQSDAETGACINKLDRIIPPVHSDDNGHVSDTPKVVSEGDLFDNSDSAPAGAHLVDYQEEQPQPVRRMRFRFE